MKIIIIVIMVISNSCIKSINTLSNINKGIDNDLILAAIEGNKDKVIDLLNQGADVDHRDRNGRTALTSASLNNYVDIVKLLIEKGADVNFKTELRLTALMVASKYGHTEIVRLLIESNANINHKDIYERTALIYASREGRKEVVKLLIEKGADVNCKDKWRETSLIYASSGGYIDTVKLLIEKGANINYKTNSSNTELLRLSDNIRNIEDKKRNDSIEIAYILIKKIKDDCIQLFTSLNKNENIEQSFKNEIKNYIDLLHKLNTLPKELFANIISLY